MRILRAVAALVLALVLQTTLARTLAWTGLGLDLVLVVVVFLGLTGGPVAGLVAGTLAGLAQDAMGSGIVGIGGLGKTVVGFLSGQIGAQFIVARPLPRFVVFFGATLVDAAIVATLQWLLSGRRPGAVASVAVQRAIGQALVGIVLFQLIETVPRLTERWRANRVRGRPVTFK